MKFLLIALLLSIGLTAVAQKSIPSSLRTRIADDEKTLSIQIDGNKNGQIIHVNRTYDVTDMSRLRKEILKYRVFTSIGIAPPIHEMPWLIFVTLGAVAIVSTLLIVSYQARKAT